MTAAPDSRGRAVLKMVAAVALVLLLAVLFPEPAWAWTPGTHIWLGE